MTPANPVHVLVLDQGGDPELVSNHGMAWFESARGRPGSGRGRAQGRPTR